LQPEPKESGVGENINLDENLKNKNVKKDFGKKVMQSTFKSTHLDDIDTEDLYVSQ
jgi:hypothetical protein